MGTLLGTYSNFQLNRRIAHLRKGVSAARHNVHIRRPIRMKGIDMDADATYVMCGDG
jgi:hypothetical protein